MFGDESRGLPRHSEVDGPWTEVVQAHLLSLTSKDDDGGEDEGEQRERGDRRQEFGLVEPLRFEEDEDATGEKCECQRDSCAEEEYGIGSSEPPSESDELSGGLGLTEERCYATSHRHVVDMNLILRTRRDDVDVEDCEGRVEDDLKDRVEGDKDGAVCEVRLWVSISCKVKLYQGRHTVSISSSNVGPHEYLRGR